MNLTPDTQAAIAQLAEQVGCSEEEAVALAVKAALMLRWLTLDVGSPLPRERGL